MILTVPQLILVLNGLHCMKELSLVLANGVNSGYNVVVLGWGIGERVSDNGPTMNGKMCLSMIEV